MKYRVLDSVRIHPDLKAGKTYGHLYVNTDMSSLAGTTHTVTAVNNSIKYYEISGSEFFWTDEMFEVVVSSAPEYEMLGQVRAFVTTLEKVIYKEPATIVFYSQDNYDEYGKVIAKGKTRKMVTRCHPDDVYDKKRGLDLAVHKIIRKEADRLIQKF